MTAPATDPAAPAKVGRHYAWIVAAVTFVTLMGASGFRSAPGVLIVPLQDQFGWSRATIGVAVSINLVLFGLAGPFAAALMQRFGIRRVVLIALMLVAAGSALTARINAPWQLYLLWGVVVGTGTGCMATVLAATVATRWFVARRGLVTGTLTAASATGQLAFLPLLAWLVKEHGWRSASIAVAGGALLVWPLVALLMRDRPEDIGLRAYGATEDDAPAGAAGNPIAAAFDGLRIAVRSKDFWLLAGSFAICGATTNGLIGTHLIPACVDHGIPETTAAGLLALMGVFDVAGTMASGWLTDRIEPRRLLFWYYGLRGLSLILLPSALGQGHHAGLLPFALFYGLDWVATVPPTVALCARAFGPERAGVVFGWVFASHQLGAAVAAWAAGAVRGAEGSYTLAFAVAGGLAVVAALFVQAVGRVRPVGPVGLEVAAV
ncbi:MAG TPA: MFS transporter [Mycobacteriales bacterium]|nr:MFS transporter [Mycobacteriales bacterium]